MLDLSPMSEGMSEDLVDIHAERREQFEAALAGRVPGVSRRRFLELMGASLALAGAVACAPPREQIVPYVRQPEEVIPGKPLFYASAHVLGGYADGVLVETHLGRPTKIEGNPQHPASLGGTDAFAQASVLNLYDPNRAQAITYHGQVTTWAEFLRQVRGALAGLRSNGGDGLRFLTETVTSPALASQLQALMQAYPQAKWHRWEALSRDNARAGAQLAFGSVVETRYRFDAADVILSLDADPFAWGPGRVRYMRDFAARRRPEQGGLNRVYAVESTPSLLGSAADHRLPLPAGDVQPFAFALAAMLGVEVGGATPSAPSGVPAGWMDSLANDLHSRGRSALVVPGEFQPPAVHAVAHAINAALGSTGNTVEYTDPVEAEPVDRTASLRELVGDMAVGRVRMLVILGGNPAFTAPSDVPLADNLSRVATRIYLGPYADETATQCDWHVAELHPLETWSDARAYDGTVSILQPTIAPLYNGKSAHELLAAFSDQPDQPSHDLVKGYWQGQAQGASGGFDAFWRKALHDGVVPNTSLPPKTSTVRRGWAGGLTQPAQPPAGSFEIVFRPDPSLYDGRFASNGWLMELPRPLTKLSWDNVALVSPATARQLGVGNQDVVELSYQGQTVKAPVWVMAGQADGSVAVTLGYGRQRGAGSGTGVGFNAYALRRADAPWFDGGLQVRRTGETYRLATTQGHYRMEGRDLVRTVRPDNLQPEGAPRPTESLYSPYPYPGYAWGMVIDQNSCVGCNACVVACQAENNIPVVGKDQVADGREMYWLRVDSYFQGPEENPRIVNQLVPCMQCETAPCELVCPVGATVHSSEGLNDMVYNRCVGTRYCSNNCPYKVRHFNFLEYSDYDTPVLKLLRNPDVTVRSRGVMEKCTYCVQRINAARIQAETEDRPIRDGEVLTACQAACPTNSIVFGNLNDPNSQVAHQRALQRNYTLLAELNTRPRTTYLATVPNPNPSTGSA